MPKAGLLGRLARGRAGYAFAVGAIMLCTLISLAVRAWLGPAYGLPAYLIAVPIIGALYGRGPALAAAGLAILAFALFLVEPAHSLAVTVPEGWGALGAFILEALGAGLLILVLREHAEQRLRHSEARFRALVEKTADMFGLHDREGKVLYLSPSVTRQMGYTLADVQDRLPRSFVDAAERDRFQAEFARLAAEPGASSAVRYRMRAADGTWRWLEMTLTNLLEDPAVRAIISNSRDLTTEVEAQQRLEAEVEQRTRELRSLYQADAVLYRSLRLGTVLQALVETAADLLQADAGSVMVWDADGDRLVTRASIGFTEEQRQRLTLARGEGVSGLAAESGEPVVVVDLPHDARIPPHLVSLRESLGTRSLIAVPITLRGEVFGVFNLNWRQQRTFQEADLRLLTALGQRAALAVENAQLYERAVQAAALQERQRLARELHDSVSQVLYSIGLNASSVAIFRTTAPDRVDDLVRDILGLAEAGLAEMQALIFELRPESLEQEGLVVALEKRAAALHARHGVELRGTLGDEPMVSVVVKETMYRIAQEALQNTAKHARARTVEITLATDDELTLCVADDGKGFDQHGDFPGHLGLLSMRERAQAVGGTVEITSAPGQGTRVVARVPVHR
jgi:PAS domain S-box-containing protein